MSQEPPSHFAPPLLLPPELELPPEPEDPELAPEPELLFDPAPEPDPEVDPEEASVPAPPSGDDPDVDDPQAAIRVMPARASPVQVRESRMAEVTGCNRRARRCPAGKLAGDAARHARGAASTPLQKACGGGRRPQRCASSAWRACYSNEVRNGRREDEAADATVKRPPARLPDIGVSVVVLNGDQRGSSAPLRGTVRIGKAPDNDLVLSDHAVSRYHCEIVRAQGGFLVRDLGSTNGTLLDGLAVSGAVAPMGTVLKVGGVDLALRPEADLVEVEPHETTEFEGVIGHSVAMRRIFRVLESVAATDATVLLQGETGSGKDVLARALIRRSRRAEPCVIVDCSAVTPSLLSSELFGHERGAFTGAVAQRKGAFETAHGGTVFLDELGELPLEVQPMLLRVLEAREFRRVGGNQVLRADVRVVAATSRDLEREVAAGKFREDLFFRLAVIPVRVPPLRSRREDIPVLVQYILGQIPGGTALQPSERTMQWLAGHDWPGNVRELRNLLERATYLSRAAQSGELLLPMLPTRGEATEDALFRYTPGGSYREARKRVEDEFERRYVTSLLAEHQGNISHAARAAQMDRKYLGALARKHGLRAAPDDAD
jgi:DNA-binding NtrC family response regulator